MGQDVCRALVDVSEGWFAKLRAANDKKRIYPEPAFSRMLFAQWFIICAQLLVAKGPGMVRDFRLLAHLDRLGLRRGYLVRHFLEVVATRVVSTKYRFFHLFDKPRMKIGAQN
jgi:hypothetical protein